MNYEHPDANLLAAFTENRLGGREREDLLAHLAGCEDCRQIVALSSEPATLAKPRLISPAWRWAAAVAAAALVLTGTWGLRLILLSTQNVGPPITVTRRMEPLPAPPAIEPQMAPTTSSRTQRRPAMRSSMAKAAAQIRARAKLPAPPTASPNEIAARSKSEQDKVAPVPAAAPYKIAALDLPAAKKIAPPQPGALRQRVAAPMSTSFGMSTAKGFVPHSPLLWRVNSLMVEQSLDGGVTWRPVSISDGAQFHAVAFDGTDVWAGGTNGVLFLSRDAGSTWKKIAVAEPSATEPSATKPSATKPSATRPSPTKPGATLTGTIVAIRLPAPSEIILETDAGDQWISRDGGISWNGL
jgi:hypothetical protein